MQLVIAHAYNSVLFCSCRKLIAVLLAVAGVLVVGLGAHSTAGAKLLRLDGNAHVDTLVGYLLVMLSTTSFSLKEVLVKKYFPQISLSPTPFTDALLIVGLIGAGTAVLTLPALFLLDATGIETFEL